ncbi:MAG: hypothetical protein JWO38_4157 [Gemmataceae bacterium]|nr:hypothetical protein [Gemmataceae bacterium]
MTDPGSQDDGWDELARELGLDKSPSPPDKAAPAARPTPARTPPPGDEPKPVGEDRPGRGHRRREEPVAASADVEDVGFPEGEPEALADEAEFEPEDAEGGEGEGEPSAGEGQAGEGQPGPGRKRRRRRRRRKKGGAAPGTVETAEAGEAGEAGEEPGAGDETEEPVVPTAAPARPRRDEGRPRRDEGRPPRDEVRPPRDEVRPGRDEDRPPRDEVDEAGADEVGWDTEEESGAVPLAAEEDTGGEVLRDLIATWNVPSWDEIVTGLYRPER